MRVLVLLLVGSVVLAGGIKSEEADLRSKDTERIERGAAALAERNDAAAVDVVVRVVRKCAKENDRQNSAFDKDLVKGFGLMADAIAMIRGEGSKVKSQSDYNKLQKKFAKSREISNKGAAMVLKAIKRVAPHLMRTACALDALDAMKSTGAVERLAEIVATEPPGLARQWMLAGLIDRETSRLGDLLLELRGDRDPRTRALAVRGLIKHVQREGVSEALVEASTDDSWQVRRAAHAGLAAAENAEALAAAYARESGDERRLVARYLFNLGKGKEPKPAHAVAFGCPFESLRVRFVIVLSEGVEPLLPRIEGELQRALDALPDGATVQVVTVGPKVESFAKAPLPLRPGTAKKIVKWLSGRLWGGQLSGTLLKRNLVPSYDHPSRGKRVFGELPDSIYLILPGTAQEDADSAFGDFKRWNRACDARLYVRVLGKKPTEKLVTEVQKQGGTISGEGFE